MANHPDSLILNAIKNEQQSEDPLNQYLVELEQAVRLLKRDTLWQATQTLFEAWRRGAQIFILGNDAPSPVMFSDANGLIHIFWLGNQNKLSYSQTLPDNLDTPPAWRTKSDLDNSVFDFDAGVDAQGGVHVAYVKNPVPGTGTAGAFYRKSSDGGRTWAPANLLYESPYFRSINAEKARIRMTVADGPGEERLYIVWDDRPQKRIFLATSADGGLNWAPIKEMVGPDSKLGFRTPYNADIDVLEDKVLATWFVGETGARCTPYSWSSSDEVETWSEQLPILPESTQCPEKGNFVSIVQQ